MLRQALPEAASTETLGARGHSIFHHFPVRRCFVVYKCRRSSDLGFTRGSLGSSRSAIELRPLVVQILLRIDLADVGSSNRLDARRVALLRKARFPAKRITSGLPVIRPKSRCQPRL